MNEDKAPADYRCLIRAQLNGTTDGESLQNVNTTPLPNGALCFVNSESALFVLAKTSVQPEEVALVVAPGSGPGRWVRLVGSTALAGPMQLQATAAAAFAVDGNFGQSSSSTFALAGGSTGHPNWALTAAGGIVTYSGPSRPFMLLLQGSFQVGNAGSPRVATAGISINDDLTGAIADSASALSTTLAVASSDYSLGVALYRRLLVTGDTLRVKAGAAAGAVSLSGWFNLSAIPC